MSQKLSNGQRLYVNKESRRQENIVTINMCVPNIWAPKYMKQTLAKLKRKIHMSILTVWDFNTPL